MTTPAFYARICPSPDDRVTPVRLAEILAETRNRLEAKSHQPVRFRCGVNDNTSITRKEPRNTICERCGSAPRKPGGKSKYCAPCGKDARRELTRECWRRHRVKYLANKRIARAARPSREAAE